MANTDQVKPKRQRNNGQGSVFKRGGKGAYIIQWYDADGQRREESTRQNDKATAQRILYEKTRKVALRRDGVIDARADATAKANTKPIADHLNDYEQYLLADGCTAKHARETHTLALRVAERGRIERTGDLTPSRVIKAIGAIKSDG